MNAALLAAVRSALCLRRGDLWRAGQQCDHVLKHQLLTVMQWHPQCRPSPQAETWDDGRYLERWADRGAVAALPATFARYDGPDQ